jgi:hypothetical protein
MSKVITIKFTKVSTTAGPFTITDQFGNVIAIDVLRKTLIDGISYIVDNNVTMITLTSTGKCKSSKTVNVAPFSTYEYANIKLQTPITACLWRHLTDIQLYNNFYGNIEPYIIEYPNGYSYQDEILQNIIDYTKVYTYLPSTEGAFNYNTRVETNNNYFNKAIIYNGQQSSGVLNLVPKPLNNLQAYGAYPKFHTDSKTIVYTKSDNFYQFNTFWALQKSSQVPMFNTSCESLSIDKIINQINMDYSTRSFTKAPLRAKDIKIRLMLTDRSDIHLVSQFLLSPSQISYK